MNKESYSYYKNAYRANKKYRVLKGSDDYGEMLTKDEYNDMRDAGMSTKEIVYNQFHFYHRDTAKKIQENLLDQGFKVSMKNIQARNYTKEIYDTMNETYHMLTQSMSSKAAAALISYTYYGS